MLLGGDYRACGREENSRHDIGKQGIDCDAAEGDESRNAEDAPKVEVVREHIENFTVGKPCKPECQKA